MKKEDLEKLSDNSLIEFCKVLNIDTTQNISRDEYISLIIEAQKLKEKTNDYNQNIKQQQHPYRPNGIGMAGAIINIIGASLGALTFLILALLTLTLTIFAISAIGLLIIFIIFFLFCLSAIIANAKFMIGNKNNKIIAGVLGVLFGFLLGGILVLVSEPKIDNLS